MTALEVRDGRLNEIISDGPVLKRAGGFEFTEGPVWSASGTLVFSDIPASTLYEFDPATDRVTCYRRPSHKANGNTYDHQGRLITCEHATSRVVREEADGSLTVLAAEYAGAELNSPNDVVVDKAGGIWFTDPPYGRMDMPVGVERPFPQPVRGLYRLGRKTVRSLCWPTTSSAPTACVSPMTKGLCSSTTRLVCTSVASRSKATCSPARESGSRAGKSGLSSKATAKASPTG